jgi:hypothetical protein
MIRFLSLFLAFSLPCLASESVRKAVFSDHQIFWPGLEGKGRPASKMKGPKPGKGEAVRLAVLPVEIKEYSESIPCDSCHRLSANGMEFFLENYLNDRMEKRFAGQKVDLVAPSDPLVGKRVDLMAYLDSLKLPWDKWLADSGQEVVYRPRDRFTKPEARKRMDKLGGLLGATHLLLPARVHVQVKPTASNTHTGGLAWGFHLVLWNVAEGGPEWALAYEDSEWNMDLDESLEGRLDKALGAVWDGMPAELQSLWAAEPR